MKRKLKQLFAVVMAVAMVLSLSVTAGATPVASGDLLFDNTTGSGGVVTELPKSGGIEAASTSEGPMPEDPVEVVLPTIPANQSRNDGLSANSAESFSVFDIILDPHGLINKTQGARYTTSGGSTKTFDEESRLYFLSAFDATANTQTYGGESYPLTIVNKGRKGVNVNLSLNFTYDNQAVTLISGKDGLSMKSGDEATSDVGAEMYFALTKGTGDKKTVHPVVDIESEDANTNVFVTVSGKGDYLQAITFDPNGEVDTPAAAFDFETAATDADIEALQDKLDDFTITLSYNKPATIMSGGDLQYGTISGDSVWSTLPDGYSIESGDFVVEEEEGGEYTVSIKSGGTVVASVTLLVKAPDPRTMKETTTTDDNDQVINFKKRDTGVIVETAIEGNEEAYLYKWVDPDSVTDEPQGITSSGYYWDLDTTVTDFPTLTFNLEGDINDDDMWDFVASNSDPTDPTHPGISFELIWDVMQRSTYYSNVPYGNSAVENTGAVAMSGEKPKITETKPATGSSSTTKKNATITWAVGNGDYANYTPDTTVTLSNGNTATVSVNGQTITYTNAWGNLTSGTTATVTFKDPTGAHTEIVQVESDALR